MDPGRQAMLANLGPLSRGDSKGGRDGKGATGPRPNPRTRVTKAAKAAKGNATANSAQNLARHLSAEEQSRQFVADEDKFVLQQSKKKADIRVREGRAKPIDHLAFNLRYIENRQDIFDDIRDDLDIEIKDPAAYIESLDRAQVTELIADIGPFLTLEMDEFNRQYWVALRDLCASRELDLDPIRKEEKHRSYGVSGETLIENLKLQPLEGLEEYERRIRSALAGSAFIDREFQEYALGDVLFFKAKKKVEAIFAKISEARDKLIEQRGPVEKREPKPPPGRSSKGSAAARRRAAAAPAPAAAASNEDTSLATKALYDREAAQGLLENEELFTAEARVPNPKKPEWAAKYRPRRPRYFNRVQMGYEWNKYNQTHFDHDNPPPKVVQGYKFNIFYPDLTDSTKTPTYKIFREDGRKRGESFAPAGEEDTCLIIFKAGPPYEDIAFRIVDRQWDFSAKKERGFKCTFDKGILQLHFNFKKIFYRK